MPVSSEPAAEPDEQSDSLYFATDRSKSTICLELRLPNGSRRAMPYAYFTELHFDPDRGIEISTTGKKIKITGRNLGKLFDQLITYRVRYVQADVGRDTGEDGLFVKEITVAEL